MAEKEAKPGDIAIGREFSGIETIIDDIENGDEPWRREARARIDRFRKADLRVKIVNSSGAPVKGAEVAIAMKRHSFHFGGVVSERQWARRPDLYENAFLAMGFNAAGFNNTLKMKYGPSRGVEKVIRWLRERDIFIRGHCILWPDKYHLPKKLAAALKKHDGTEDSKRNIEKQCVEMVAGWARLWDVDEWDVVNEPRDSHGLQDILGEGILAKCFRIAAENARNPHARLCFNDNRIVSDPYPYYDKSEYGGVLAPTPISTPKIEAYIATLDALLKAGAPVGFLGFQSRFARILKPETVLARLNLFNKYGLPIEATEFEIKREVGDESRQAVFMEQLMTVYFSHPLVDGIFAWTLFPRQQTRNILNSDGTPNLKGKVWLYLTRKRWSTNATLRTSSDGTVSIRAFKGVYDITVKANGRAKTVSVDLEKDSFKTIAAPSDFD